MAAGKRLFAAGSRQAPDPYDQFLEQKGFYRKHTARDASCLFRVISEQVYGTQQHHFKIRDDCVSFMRKNNKMFENEIKKNYFEYVEEMAMRKTYGTLVELRVMGHRYKKNVMLFSAFNTGNYFVKEQEYEGCLNVFFTPEKHFDSIFAVEYIENLAFTQGCCFELLYEKVYGIPDVMYAVEQMLHDPHHATMKFVSSNNNNASCEVPDKIMFDDGREFILDQPENTNCILDNYELCHFHNKDFVNFADNVEKEATECKNDAEKVKINRKIESLLPKKFMSCVRQLLEEGITPFPYKVAKGLDPDIYRNIEFDVWSETRKMRRYSNAGNMVDCRSQFQVGLKCQVQMRASSSSLYNCHIQEMSPKDGPCIVFVEELGEMRSVQSNQLRLLSNQGTYRDVPQRQRRTNQNGQRGTRKRVILDSPSKMNGMGNAKIIYANDYDTCNNGKCHIIGQFNDFVNFEVTPYEVIAMPFKQNKNHYKNDKASNTATRNDSGGGETYNSHGQNDDDDDNTEFQEFIANCISPAPFGYCDANLPFPYDPNIPPPNPYAAMPFNPLPALPSANPSVIYYSPCNSMYPIPQPVPVPPTSPGVTPIYTTMAFPPGSVSMYCNPNAGCVPQVIPIKQKDLLCSPFPINYFGVGPSYSPHGTDIPVHDLVTLRYFYNLGHEYFKFIYSNYGMNGVMGLSQPESQTYLCDSGMQTIDCESHSLSAELPSNLKVDNSDQKTDGSSQSVTYNKRYSRHNNSNKKEHKSSSSYRGNSNKYSKGGSAKKEHSSQPSTIPQQHQSQPKTISSQQQQLHIENGNVQNDYNSSNNSERMDVQPVIDFYQYSPPLMHQGYTSAYVPYIPDGEQMYYIPPIISPPQSTHHYGLPTFATPFPPPQSGVPTSNEALHMNGENYNTSLNEPTPYYTPYQTIYYQSAGRPQSGAFPLWHSAPYPTFIPGHPLVASVAAPLSPAPNPSQLPPPSSSAGAVYLPPPPNTSNSQSAL